MQRKIGGSSRGTSTCPHCGGALVNVQGVTVCGRCSWTA